MVGCVGFETTIIGLKVRIGKYNGLYINELPGRPMHHVQYSAALFHAKFTQHTDFYQCNMPMIKKS